MSTLSREAVAIAVLFAQQAQQASATASPDTSVLLLGQPVTFWAAVLGLGGGGAFVGKGVWSIFNDGVAVFHSFSESYPKRVTADLEREGVETLNLNEQVEFAKQMNEALEQHRKMIADSQQTINGLQTNGLKQLELMTNMQALMLQQETKHKEEIGALEGRISQMEADGKAAATALETANHATETWKLKYEEEHERAEELQRQLDAANQRADRLEQAAKTSTGEHPAVTPDTPIE